MCNSTIGFGSINPIWPGLFERIAGRWIDHFTISFALLIRWGNDGGGGGSRGKSCSKCMGNCSTFNPMYNVSWWSYKGWKLNNFPYICCNFCRDCPPPSPHPIQDGDENREMICRCEFLCFLHAVQMYLVLRYNHFYNMLRFFQDKKENRTEVKSICSGPIQKYIFYCS